MARTVTLAQMRERIRRRADMVNSTYVSDEEVTQYTNDALADLYDLLMQKFGDDYYTIAGPETSFVANTLNYDLPDNFLKIRGVDLKIDSNNWVTLKPFMFSERNKYNTLLTRGVLAYESTYYKLLGNQIQFTQIPGGQNVFRIWYVPALAELVNDSDTFDGFDGWEKYAEVYGALQCLIKEESDTTQLERELARLQKRVEDAAANRETGFGYRVTDTRNITDSEISIFTGFRS